jgi:TPP-dependent pyruvate/acetoin dehydrogenase alpha subunit
LKALVNNDPKYSPEHLCLKILKALVVHVPNSERGKTKTVGPIEAEEYEKHGLSEERLLHMLRRMIEIRRFEECVERLFLQEGALIGPSHLYLGEEAIAAGALGALNDDDLIATTYRGHGHAIAKEVPMKPLMAELFGKATGTCKGLGGSMHVAIYPEKGSVYATAIVGSGIPIATGMGLALQQEAKGRVAMTFFGEGATNTGAFHEGINLASVWKVPVVFVCENNMYAMSTRADYAVAAESIAARALAYKMQSTVADGNDCVSVYIAAKEAVDAARKNKGPTLLDCITYKQKGHGVYDIGDYRPREEVEAWLKRDPIKAFEARLLKANLATQTDFDEIEEEVRIEVEESVKFARESPVLPFEELAKYVYVR